MLDAPLSRIMTGARLMLMIEFGRVHLPGRYSDEQLGSPDRMPTPTNFFLFTSQRHLVLWMANAVLPWNL